jgi:S1-C subfamily serine protease
MQHPSAGERLQISQDPQLLVRLAGRDVERIAVAAVCKSGAILPFNQAGVGQWHLPSLPSGESVEIVAYITDDRQGGFVNPSYPIDIEISGQPYRFPEPAELLAAVILAEIYEKSGTRRMKVSNEGFAFGIDAYARARNIQRSAIPFVRQTAPDRSYGLPNGTPDIGRARPPSAASASGSGVFVTPNVIVTNAHVLDDGHGFSLGRTRQDLIPLCVDPIHDLALLQSPTQGTPLPIRIGSPIWLGESVLASGYPLMDVLGSDLKVSTGNISGLTGSIGDVSRFQFTAPIGSGSSGGAVIDEFGNLVGITSASLAHGSMRERGSISENVNFGIRAALVYEMLGAAGIESPALPLSRDNNRREVVQRLRSSVVSIAVAM